MKIPFLFFVYFIVFIGLVKCANQPKQTKKLERNVPGDFEVEGISWRIMIPPLLTNEPCGKNHTLRFDGKCVPKHQETGTKN